MQARSHVACSTLAAAQKLKIAASCYLALGKKAPLDLVRSPVVRPWAAVVRWSIEGSGINPGTLWFDKNKSPVPPTSYITRQ